MKCRYITRNRLIGDFTDIKVFYQCQSDSYFTHSNTPTLPSGGSAFRMRKGVNTNL
jgi:hypothetical protein